MKNKLKQFFSQQIQKNKRFSKLDLLSKKSAICISFIPSSLSYNRFGENVTVVGFPPTEIQNDGNNEKYGMIFSYILKEEKHDEDIYEVETEDDKKIIQNIYKSQAAKIIVDTHDIYKIESL